jgi:hypothetical protein
MLLPAQFPMVFDAGFAWVTEAGSGDTGLVGPYGLQQPEGGVHDQLGAGEIVSPAGPLMDVSDVPAAVALATVMSGPVDRPGSWQRILTPERQQTRVAG